MTKSLDPIDTAAGREVTESTPEDLATLRYLYDLALQPVGDLRGFTRLEQIGGSALRYQISYAGYALAMAQYTRTPAFAGYHAEAQGNLIRKMCDKRVWGYWATERLAGYGRWNPDPMVFGNIMYTGFFAAMLAFYETLNDDRQFDDNGSLPLVWSDSRRYDYGFTAIATAIRRNMRASKHTLYPCEPHLIYPMCNTIAIAGLEGYDRLHGTDFTEDLTEKIRRSFTRYGYLRSDGRFLFGRGPLGVKLPPMLANDAVMTYWLTGLMPDLAEQTWESLRTNRLHMRPRSARISTGPIDRLDVGSYKPGDAWAWVNIRCAAREIGDTEAAQAVQASIDKRFTMETSPHGAQKLAGVSSWVNCVHAFAQFVSPGSVAGLVRGEIPPAWRSGPILAEAAYPDVLVARAVSDDGDGLDLVLYPGATTTRTVLRVERLTPGRTYRVSGAAHPTLTADDHGHALIHVDLRGRTAVGVSGHP